MSSELVQTTFEGFNYEVLPTETRDFVIQKTDETHGLLKRTAKNIIKVGQNLMEVKEALPHGQYLPWLKSEFGLSDRQALNFTRVASRFGTKSEIISDLSPTIIYALAAPSTKDEIIDGVLSGEIDPTLEAIKREKEALKKAEDAEKARQKSEYLLSSIERRNQSQQEEISSLSTQIETLQQEMATLTTPKVEIRAIEVTPPETTKRLQDLETQVATLTRQRDNLSKQNEELSADLDAQEADREREARELRIRKAWEDTTDAIFKAVKTFQASIPLPVDMQIFDTDDWARLSDVEAALMHAFKRCASLRQDVTDRFIDASEG